MILLTSINDTINKINVRQLKPLCDSPLRAYVTCITYVTVVLHASRNPPSTPRVLNAIWKNITAHAARYK